jgi:hypothetical protein
MGLTIGPDRFAPLFAVGGCVFPGRGVHLPGAVRAAPIADVVTPAAGLDLSDGFEEGIRDHGGLQMGGAGQGDRGREEAGKAGLTKRANEAASRFPKLPE